ncbi:MAG TPA: penicillin-binding transpeptidase domain-containing protein [Longimicrobiales bacterium]|nr:penicillin-binding transpeptidase domain-containing protein [Longimicrobiales bacterium]
MKGKNVVSFPSAWRRRLVLAGWVAACVVVCARAGQIQVAQGAQWSAMAEAQHKTDKEIVAARGSVLDRDGTLLAVSRETYRVSVAPQEIPEGKVDETRTLLRDVLGISAQRAKKLVAPGRRWVVAPGLYPPSVREQLAGIRGVYAEREMERYHPHGDLARGVLGVVQEGAGLGGVEQTFDALLRGRSGREVVARDNVGRAIPGETFLVESPQSGGQVILTLDLDMQEIARQALQEAIESSQARGGDVLITDPGTGEVLALVSIRDGQTAGLGVVNTPYEPGSTLKPFTVAGLLDLGLASLSDEVDTGDGVWEVEKRVLHDTHPGGVMTIADALRVSSNVGIAMAAQAMTPGVQYENLRDFGFGVPTGIEIPGEVGGMLRKPDKWTGQSRASLAIGYEISVTPLQMAMAYGALANGGRLMEPHLVKEIRDPDGRVVERFEPRVVRQVVDGSVARAVSRVLVDVVEDGTGTQASLGLFKVAGKTGTSRTYTADRGYAGGHSPSFVGFFPAEDPQLVVFVKLENPKGTYYGGTVAAPVTRATMEAALAARATPLDRAQLLRSVRAETVTPASAEVRFASRSADPPAPTERADADATAVRGGPPVSSAGIPVPDVAGLPARVAVRRLHAVGLRVRQDGAGSILGTYPEAGSRMMPGDTVRLKVGRSDD